MDKHRAHAVANWTKFLNPETLRTNLITASIFRAAYETLRASVIDHIRGFFTDRFEENGPIVSDNYRTKVLSLDKSPLRASLLWFKQMGAVDDNDIAQVDRIREHRNEVAHDLPKFIATANADINVKLISAIYSLVTKIDRWWIRAVEIPTNPDFDGQEIVDNDIESGNMLLRHYTARGCPGPGGEAAAVGWHAAAPCPTGASGT